MADARPTTRAPRPVAILAAAALAVAAAAAPFLIPAAGASSARAAAPHYLLALGDSLAAGYEPTDGNAVPPTDPATGFPDEGYPGGYARDLASARNLSLVDLGCPGETTTSMLERPAIAPCTALYKALVAAPTQESAALDFLARHKGAVSLVTIDIGANNVDGCFTKTVPNLSCLNAGEATARTDLPKILAPVLSALKNDDPAAKVLAMNYYDPFLGVAYTPGGVRGDLIATLSGAATAQFNRELTSLYSAEHVKVVDVSSAFRTTAVTPVVAYGGKRLPENVATVCRWTFMCPVTPKSGTAASPNIHPNPAGYSAIARAFEAVLPR